jgi:hypothetical protein
MAIPDLRGKSEAIVVKYYGGTPTRAPVIRWDGRHENGPEIGKFIPPEVVETSSFNLATTIVQEGKLLQLLNFENCEFRAR